VTSEVSATSPAFARAGRSARRRYPVALALVVALAAVLRLATLGTQSLWYDEAFTPVHVLHPSLDATLRSVVRTENAPPLWYVLEWAFTRVLGTSAVDLRLISALAGIATVAVVWAIARRLAGRRAALAAAVLSAVNPLFVWYSQEARAYALFVFAAALAMLCFVRALEQPTRMRLLQFGLSASAALLTHYFAVFLLAPMVLWLGLSLMDRTRARNLQPARRGDLALVSLPVLTGLALVPLVLAQAGHGTQWIGRWALSSRLAAIPQYYLTGYSGAPLGHGVELAVALIALAGLGFGLWRVLTPREERGALVALALAACGVLAPVALALAGVDYLAPRNVVAAMVPVTVLLGVAIAARRTASIGPMLAALLAVAFLAVTIDFALSPRLQRGDWAAVARLLRTAAPDRAIAPKAGPLAIVTVQLGSAPLQYYLPPLHNLPAHASVAVSEIDEVGYAPLRSFAGRPPASSFQLVGRSNLHGLIVYRFVSRTPVTISGQALRADAIASGRPEALVSGHGTR
jgi:mannosyltransferase